MPIFTSAFTVGTDDNGTTGLIPEFLGGVQEYNLTAQGRPEDVAHDIIEHGRSTWEGDAQTELAAVGAYAVGRWGFTATHGNMAAAITSDVTFILQTDAIRGAALNHSEPVEKWVRDGVRAGIRELVAELRDEEDEDATERAISIIRDRRQIEAAVQHGAERCVNVYGSSDLAFEAFRSASAAAFEILDDIDEMAHGTTVIFTTDTDTRETTARVLVECGGCGADIDPEGTCCE
jgi:hypothetical protein